MSVLRKRLDASFTVVPNELLDDPDLDLAAKGLVCYMLAKPDGWNFSAVRIAREMPEGRDAIYAALNRAEASAWVQRRDIRKPDGTFMRQVIVRNNRLLSWEPDGLTEDGLAEVGPTDVGATVDVSKDLEANTEIARTEGSQKLALASRSRPVDPIFEVLFMVETGLTYSPETSRQLTPSARGALNKAAAGVRQTDVSPEELLEAIEAWPTVMDDATCTANAIAKHLPRLRAAARGNVARKSRPTEFDETMERLAARREEA
jgi:hypothetical protein